jgi:hypothetical protein
LSWTTPDSAVVVDRLRELEDWFALAGLLPELDLESDRELAAGLLSSNRAPSRVASPRWYRRPARQIFKTGEVWQPQAG